MGNSQPEQPRILIIDDSRLVRALLSNVLGDEFKIIEAVDGEAGWEALLADNKIQVVLTDADMPQLNGYDLIKRIRAHHEQHIKDIPINMITADDDEKSRQHALGLGATDFVTKPFDKPQLLARIRAQVQFDQTSRDLVETSEALVQHATNDHLTGLKSQRYLLKRGEQDVAFASRHKQELAVISIDIDSLETIISQQNTEAANKLLTTVASCLEGCIRKEDTLARTGNTNFAIIAPTLGKPDATLMCERIRQQISAFDFGTGISLTTSLGLVNHNFNATHKIEDLLAHAENFSAKAKAAGGNCLITDKQKQVPTKSVSIDAVLRALAHGDEEKLIPHLPLIVAQILPLLILCNDKQQWNIDEQLQAIADKTNTT